MSFHDLYTCMKFLQPKLARRNNKKNLLINSPIAFNQNRYILKCFYPSHKKVHEQNVLIFVFYMCVQNFRNLEVKIKKVTYTKIHIPASIGFSENYKN